MFNYFLFVVFTEQGLINKSYIFLTLCKSLWIFFFKSVSQPPSFSLPPCTNPFVCPHSHLSCSDVGPLHSGSAPGSFPQGSFSWPTSRLASPEGLIDSFFLILCKAHWEKLIDWLTLCRSFIFAYLTRGQPVPLNIVLYATIFCSLNGFLQGHHLLHCAPQSTHTWLTGPRRATGVYGPLVQSEL